MAAATCASPVFRRCWILFAACCWLIPRSGYCWIPSLPCFQCYRLHGNTKTRFRHEGELSSGGAWTSTPPPLRRQRKRRSLISLVVNGVALTSIAQDEGGVIVDYETLEVGMLPGHRIVKEYAIPALRSFAVEELVLQGRVAADDVQRLNLTASNVSIPVALMLLDPSTYPSMSRARKACRKLSVLVRGQSSSNQTTTTRIGLVGDRVVLAEDTAVQIQQRFGSGYFAASPPGGGNTSDTRHRLPVLYEDDYVAIVHKPAGLLVYRAPQSSASCPTVRSALPRCLVPPARGTMGALGRPMPVHRLDKPTSGCLVVAKTKPALVHLGRGFHDRTVQKTYTAVVSGTLPRNERIPDSWHLIDDPLDGKQAVTYWRVLGESPCAFALDQTLSLVEMQPKTGRYHQLRRHMALVLGKPIAGDDDYDGNSPSAKRLRHRGLCLCATSITLPHPWYNTPQGRQEYQSRFPAGWSPRQEDVTSETVDGYLWMDETRVNGATSGTAMITARVNVPKKFHALILHEQERYQKFTESRNKLSDLAKY
jgi:23S rRNA-/tRNA-specific pseudouridylate synthase